MARLIGYRNHAGCAVMTHTALLLLLFAQVSALEILGVDFSQSDKVGHFWLGAATAGVAMLALDHWKPEAPWYTRALVGTGAAALVGAGKEWADSGDLDHHTVDRKDFIATTLGGATVALSLCWNF